MDIIAIIGWTLAGGVILGGYLVSRRGIHVHQENHNTAAPHIETAAPAAGGIGPVLIGGLFAVIVGGIVLTAMANVVQSATEAFDRSVNQPASVPAVVPAATAPVLPTAVPVATFAPVRLPEPIVYPSTATVQDDAGANVLEVAMVVLGVMFVLVWGYIAAMLIRRAMRGAVLVDSTGLPVQPKPSEDPGVRSRERRMEEILPDVVNDLAKL